MAVYINSTDRLSIPFNIEAGLGNLPGIRRFRRFGNNPDVDTGTVPESVWGIGGEFSYPSSADTVNIVSSNAADTSAGTGMRIVRLTGLNSAYEEITEDITLNGVTPVTSTSQFLILHECFGISSGSNEANVGTITMTHTTSGASLTDIKPGEGQTQHLFGIVPAGFVWAIDQVTSSVSVGGSNGFAVLHFEIMAFGTNTWRIQYPLDLGNGIPFDTTAGHADYIILPEKTRYRVQIKSVSQNNSSVKSSAAGYLISTSFIT